MSAAIPSDPAHALLGTQIWLEQHEDPARLDELFRLAAETGFGWVRLFIMWPWMEPEPGQWDFGLYDSAFDAAAIGKDGRTAASSDVECHQPEGQGGSMVRLVTKPGTAPRTFILAGGQDSRVTEVLGLDTIQPLPEWKFTLGEEEAKIASDAIADFNAKNTSLQKLVLTKGIDSLKNAALIPRDVDGARGFKAAAAYDEKNLYVSYEVTSPSEWDEVQVNPRTPEKKRTTL
jgi:hypothetical protein